MTAELKAIESFFNSFIREFGKLDFIKVFERYLDITIDANRTIRLNLKRNSVLGNFEYNSIWLVQKENINEVDIVTALEILKDRIQILGDYESLLPKALCSFYETKKIINSYGRINDFLSAEQNLNLGHPFHPYSKFRSDIDQNEARLYMPEYKNHFKIVWLEVNPKIFNIQKNETSLDKVLYKDVPGYKEGYHYLPVHPLQWRELKENASIKRLVKYSDIKIIGDGLFYWHPQSSVRSLYCKDLNLQIKLSLNIKITNSKRNLSIKEVERALYFSELAKVINCEFILKEDIYMTLKVRELEDYFLCQVRETPANIFEYMTLGSLVESHFDESYLMSKLKEESLKTGWPIEYIQSIFVSKLYRNLIFPLIDLYQTHSMLVGAHLQNILVKLEGPYIENFYYRDCQGTAIVSESKQKTQKEIIEVKQDEAYMLFGYYFFINTIFKTISSTTRNKTEENRMINLVLKYLERNLEADFFSYLISDEILNKSNWLCALNEMNEATDNNPWGIYQYIQNPFAHYVSKKKYQKDFNHTWQHKGKICEFRLFDLDKDLDDFHRWHNSSFISDFWELDKDKAYLEDYIYELIDGQTSIPVIYSIDGENVGYFEIYWAYDDRISSYVDASYFDRGLHLLIGNQSYLRTSFVLDSIKEMTKFLFDSCSLTGKVFGEPRLDNTKIIKIAQNLPGWEVKGEIIFPHKTARHLECERFQFFRELQ